jgi:hypothetical protein
MGQLSDRLGEWQQLDYDPVTQKGTWVYEDENMILVRTVAPDDQLTDENKASFNESADKRWGDGKVVASIDLPTYYNKIVPAKQNGDDAWIKRFLNDPDNRAYRTFKGKI